MVMVKLGREIGREIICSASRSTYVFMILFTSIRLCCLCSFSFCLVPILGSFFFHFPRFVPYGQFSYVKTRRSLNRN